MADPDTFRVSPSLQGMPNVSAPPVESAAPGLLVRAGQTITSAAGKGGEIYQNVLREQNATRVTEALTSLQQYQHDLTYGVDGDASGWSAQLGKNALERPGDMALDEEYGGQFDSQIETLSLGLGNEAQRKLFRDRANAMSVDLRGRVQEHVSRQGQQYRIDTLSGVIGSGQRLMGTATDPLDMARAADMTRQAAAQLADMRGLADEAREDFYREMLTPGHLGALSRLQALEDVDGAEAYFNENRDELSYDATVKIEAALLEQRAIMEGGEIGEQIAGFAQSANAAAAPQRVAMPVAGAPSISSGFGPRRGGPHKGVDIAVGVGTPVRAGAGGVVSIKDDPDGFGTYVELRLDDGTKLRYAHLSGVDVEDGQRVNAGDVVARSGGARGAAGSGNSRGPHLHYEVLGPDGVQVDPVRYHQGNPQVTSQAAGLSLQDQLSRLYELNLPPRQEQEAERKIRSIHGARQDAERETKESVLSRAFAEIDRTGSLSNASRAAIVGADLAGHIPSLRSFEKATQDRRAGGTVSEADGLVQYGIARQMIAEGKVSSLEDLLPLKPYLPDNYFKQLVDDVTGSPQTARQRADSVISLMNEEIEGSGLFVDEDGKKTAETHKEYSRFVGAVTRQIEREQEVTNRPVSTDRQREIVLGMVSQQVISATGEQAAGYQVRRQYDAIPAANRARIVRSLQREGIAVPSQRQVVSTWLRIQAQ